MKTDAFARRPCAALAVWLALNVTLGCAPSREPVASERLEPVAAVRPAGALDVQLHFDEAVDLDLFVTGPEAETVYFGNSPARSGGRLLRDRRCDAAPPHRETIRFERPESGRYRVAVEYTRSCHRSSAPARYRLGVEADSGSFEIEGEIDPGGFDSRALEFDRAGGTITPVSR